MYSILIIDNESIHTNEIGLLFPGHKITICAYNKIPDTKKHNLIILSGWSHYSVLEEPSHYKKELALIQSSKIPILWICLWCQLIAHAFGSTLTLMPEKLIQEIEIRNWLDKKNYKVFEAHKYAVTSLWKELQSVAKSKYGYEIIRHASKPIWWFQFHPEVDMAHTQGKILLQEILDLIFWPQIKKK
jgi:GMP synthase-like glutamine amidotransferase